MTGTTTTGAMVRRDLTLAARRPGLLCALGLHAALTAVFLQAWGSAGIVPVLPGSNLYEQLATVQRALVIVMAPWMAARIAGIETRGDVARLSLLVNAPVSTILRARLIAVLVWIALFVCAGLPSVVLAQQMSTATPPEVLRGQLLLATVGCAAALLTLVAGRWTDNGIARWAIATTAMTMAAFMVGRV